MTGPSPTGKAPPSKPALERFNGSIRYDLVIAHTFRKLDQNACEIQSSDERCHHHYPHKAPHYRPFKPSQIPTQDPWGRWPWSAREQLKLAEQGPSINDHPMLKSTYLTETDLKDFGFRSIGNNVKISSDARIYGQENIRIGNNVRIDDFAILSAVNGYIDIGDHVFIARNAHLSGYFGIELHDFSSMAANTVIYSASDDYSGEHLTAQAIPQKYTTHIGGPVIIGKHVIIGSSCNILGPANIGEGCSIGAMSLVQHELLPWGVYVGIPCKRLKERKRGLLELEKQFLKEQNEDH